MKGDFLQEFCVFRLRHLAEHVSSLELIRLNNTMPESVSNKTSKRAFELAVEECCYLYSDFWIAHLNSLPRANEALQKILRIQTKLGEVEARWAELVRLGQNSSDLMISYAKFLITVVHDVALGEELIFKAKLVLNITIKKKTDVQQFYNNDDIREISLPFAIASGDAKHIGQILNANIPFCSLFSYFENEIKGRNVNVLTPTIFREYHDQFIINSLNSGRLVFEKK